MDLDLLSRAVRSSFPQIPDRQPELNMIYPRTALDSYTSCTRCFSLPSFFSVVSCYYRLPASSLPCYVIIKLACHFQEIHIPVHSDTIQIPYGITQGIVDWLVQCLVVVNVAQTLPIRKVYSNSNDLRLSNQRVDLDDAHAFIEIYIDLVETLKA